MWIVIGLVVGAWFGFETHTSALAGALLGAIAGGLLQHRLGGKTAPAESLADRLERLEVEVGALREELRRLRPVESALQTDAAEHTPTAAASIDAESPPEHLPQAAPATSQWSDAVPPVDPVAPLLPPAAPAESLDALYVRVRGWLLGGNTVVRVGLLVLFFGFAFLARYAVEHSLLPPELRMAAIALGGVALLVVGWRLRMKNSGYALSMQGGGVAVLYLTVFAALRLYAMLPASLSFALLLAIVGLSAALAILQNAPALAVIGTAGGFLAPILASTGQGDPLSLFGYYTLLNVGVLLIAWKKAWRVLNLVGFVFTFSIALAWGARDYRPELFATIEPFLIAFFLMYVAAAVLYAWRQAPRLTHYVDGGLVFGTPVVGFGLQAALVEPYAYGLAWSALALGGFYLLLARWLLSRARTSLSLLVESFLALGVAFLTLCIPLALDARWTAAAWALEGAALLWVGARQSRRLAMLAGVLLQLGAGVFFAADAASGARVWPVLNSPTLGALLIAVAGFFSNLVSHRHRHAWPRVLPAAGVGLLLWATLWWLAGGLDELDAWLSPREMAAGLLLLFAASAALAAALARRLDWPALHWLALLAVAGMAFSLLASADAGLSPAWGWGLAAWLVACACHAWALRQSEAITGLQGALPRAHALGLWLLTAAAAWMLAEAADARLAADSWPIAAFALAPIAMLLGVLWADRKVRWPLSVWPAAYLGAGAGGIAGALCLWVLVANVVSAGGATPLPYLPLANPLELALCGALLAVLQWWQQLRAQQQFASPAALAHVPILVAALGFWVANGALLRLLHHYLGIPWELDTLFASDTVQMALSLFWAAVGLSLTFLASRQARRHLWMLGAALLAVVVAKLFLVDMASTGTVARIVSFLGAGILLLVVGYFSPLPPARELRS